MASTNPFAWTSMPSGFDADASDKKKRSDILTKRRAQTLVNSLVTLRGETVEVGNEEKNTRREEQLKIIQKALTRGSMRESIKDCLPFLTTENDKKATSLKMKLLDVPGSIVKGCCRSVGIEGLPNIPLINKLNLGEISKHFDKVRESDEFLMSIGVKQLKTDELQAACFERCIQVGNRSPGQLRSDLGEWLDIACEPVPVARGMKVVMNDQNRRLALMGLHVARDVKASEFGTIYKVQDK
eukprot:CAMPEP_0119040080 /NCGR_PEP_ID=MMETSP1177-20130426/9913_1 /TAXON_ID=2985 /ORGANISM="Ochromonas sp, Strain CCMP1899" /LENGTH=240 /DNA_ID=CAMNT_0007004797 /DNA_START=139 /DNA_END=859 /DNA_ORIENTATION=-